MSDTARYSRTKEEKEANARRLNAEALLAETNAELSQTVLVVEQQTTAKATAEYDNWLASDSERHVLRYLGAVSPAAVHAAIAKLVRWHRLAPKCDVTFIIDSPGGDIISGFHLFDTMLWMRREGHEVTTIASGMAASMGGVLLQAGSTRIITPQASMLIHEASFGAVGSMGTIEDEVEYVKKLQGRIAEILAERSTLSVAQIKNRWKRKNWWLMADEVLELGFADKLG